MNETNRDIRLLLGKGSRLRLALLLGCLWFNSLCELLCLAALPLFIQLLFDAGGMASTAAAESLRSSAAVQLLVDITGAFLGQGLVGGQQMVVAGGIALLVLHAIRLAWMYFSISMLERYLARRKTELAGRILEGSLTADAAFRMANPDSALVNSCVQDAVQSVEDVLAPILGIANNAAVLLCLVVALLWQMPATTLIAVGGLAVFCGGFTWFNSRRQSRLGLQAQHGRETAARRAGEALGIGDAAFRQGRGSYFARRFSDGIKALAQAQQHYKVSNQIIWPYLEFTSFAVMLAVMYYADGGLAEVAPQIALLGLAMVRLRTNSINLLSYATTLRYGLPVLRRLRERMDQAGEGSVGEMDDAKPLALRQGLRLEDVRYSYPASESQSHPAVGGVSFVLAPGELLGIAGTTGCGKSTLLRLMCGELEPTSGRISADDAEVKDELRIRWRRSCGYVPQEPFLLDDDLDSNIALGCGNDGTGTAADAQALQEAKRGACIMAGAAEPGTAPAAFAGRSDALGERGTKLSGGQRQRIAVARALYGGGCALFLDEATSALDNTTQEQLEESLRELCRRRRLAVAIVAHRLSAIRHCDRILFMDQGRIAASGTYDELIENCPAFRQMANA